MTDAISENGLSAIRPQASTAAPSLTAWLDDLLGAAHDRDDLPLARLIAAVMDDLATATVAKG